MGGRHICLLLLGLWLVPSATSNDKGDIAFQQLLPQDDVSWRGSDRMPTDDAEAAAYGRIRRSRLAFRRPQRHEEIVYAPRRRVFTRLEEQAPPRRYHSEFNRFRARESELASAPVWEQPVHLTESQQSELKMMANRVLIKRLERRESSLRAKSGESRMNGIQELHAAHRLWRKARRFGADADVLLSSATRTKLVASKRITQLAQLQSLQLQDEDELASRRSAFADAVAKATAEKHQAETDKLNARVIAIRAMQELQKAKDDLEAGVKGQQEMIDLNATIAEEKQTLQDADQLKDATVKEVVKEGATVRLAKEYNELALAKYHVENAEQYKKYGAELYQQAKRDAAASVQLKESAVAKAGEAKQMFEAAQLNRLGLEETQTKVKSDSAQELETHKATKQELLLAQSHLKTGTKDRALFHYWATKSNLKRKAASELLARATRMSEDAEDAARRVQQLKRENEHLAVLMHQLHDGHR